MKIVYTARALHQLREIYAYISKDNKTAAAKDIDRIANLAVLIGQSPNMGHPTDEAGVRVMNVQPYPYLVFYKILAERDEIRILRVRHMRQR